MKYTIPAIIFAGGKSTRMGKDKSLLPFKNYSTLSQYQYDKLKQWFEEVYISSKNYKFSFSAKIIKDRHKESSPLVGLISSFETLEAEAIFVLSVDAPLVEEVIIKKILDIYIKDNTADAIIAQSPSGLQPLCGIYKRSILPLAKIQLNHNTHSLKILLEQHETKTVLFNENMPFTNVNTQDEYLKLLARFN